MNDFIWSIIALAIVIGFFGYFALFGRVDKSRKN